ncbi:hypothetical protein CAT7_11370 [Carnobacterium sp. AT7]|nr:hypothetical protein CAT7_11370 [Carnobacterium sp. AT7]
MVTTLVLPNFLSLPYEVFAEGIDPTVNLSVESLSLANYIGEPVDKIISGEEIFLAIGWNNKQAENRATSKIVLPSKITASTIEQAELINKNKVKVGTYSVDTNTINLSVTEAEAATGTLLVPIKVTEEKPGKIELEFFIDGKAYLLKTSIQSNDENKLEEETDQAMDQQKVNEENKENQEQEDSDKVEQIEETKDSEIEEKIDVEKVKETEIKETEIKNTQVMKDRAILDQDDIIFKNVTFKDEKGEEFNSTNPYDLEAKELGRLSFDLSLPEGHTVKSGDTYIFNLPSEFKPSSATSGTLGSIGKWQVSKEGEVTFTFNEGVDGDNVTGSFWFEVFLEESLMDGTIEQEIPFEEGSNTTIKFPVKPKGGKLIDKKGTINNNGQNSDEAYWQVDINTGLEQLTTPTVTDSIPTNMSYQEGSLVVYTLDVDIFGNRTESTVVDATKYSVKTDENGKLIILFDGLTEEESAKAYLLKYTTNIIEPKKGFEGTQVFKNTATLTNNQKTTSASTTVSSNYGKSIEKGAPEYNQQHQTFDWTINYNFNQKVIDADKASIKDSWTPIDVMELVPEEFAAFPVEFDENGKATVSEIAISPDKYVLVNDKSGFSLTFKDQVEGQAYQIKYQTKILGSTGTGIVNNNGTVKNQVETGTENKTGSSGTWKQKGITKKHVKTDVTNKSIDWEIKLNENGYLMENLLLEDKFIGDGLSLIENQVNSSKYELKIVDANGKEFTEYTPTYTEPSPGSPGGFKIQFNKPINESYTLSYKTYFERNSDGTASYGNGATIKWSEGENDYNSSSQEVVVTPGGHTAKNGVKSGKYNAQNKQVSWEVNTNYARLPIVSPYKISDTIPKNQEFVDETLEVYSYVVNAKGDIVSKDKISSDKYTIEFPNKENKNNLTIILKDTFVGEKTAIGISFDTKFTDEWVQDATVTNKAEVTNGENIFNLEASVEIPNGGKYANKSGKQAGEFNERVDWSIVLNPTQTKVSNYTLTDNPDLNSVLMEDTFILYEAKVDTKGNVTKTDHILEKNVDYILDVKTDNGTGKQQFSLKFENDITKAYILEYSSYIDPLLSKGEEIKNEYGVTGETTETIESSDIKTVTKNNAGGGDGSSIRGGLSIQKENEKGTVLQDAVFNLYTRDGKQLLRTGTTDEKGILKFGGLRRGNYLLKEVTAPEGYVINDKLAKGVIIDLSFSKDNPFVDFKYINKLTKIQINKIGANKLPITKSATFTIYDKDEKVVRSNIETVNGTVIVEDLAPGNYFLEEQVAPDGYIRNTNKIPFTITINEDGTQTIPIIDVVNHQGSVEWKKTTKTGEPLAGAVFNVLNKDGVIVAENVVSDEAGLVSVNDLAPGTYTIQETTTVDGYLLNTETVEFTIASSSEGTPVTLSIDNFKNYQGTAQLIKTNEAGKVLKDAVFEVRNSDGKVMDTLTSDENGRIMAEGLAPGNYTFVEISSPDGYITNTQPVSFIIATEAEGEPEMINTGNFENYQGSVILQKTDATNKDLAGAAFDLYDANGNLIQADVISNKKGQVKVENLAPGNYVFKETKAPNGYVLNETEITFTVASEHIGKPEQIKAGSFINYQGSVVLEKVDSKGKALADAVFDVVDSEGMIVQKDLMSTKDGKIFVENLAPGEYTFIETVAPKGYVLNETTVPFTIVDSAKGKPVEVDVKTFVNYQGSVEWKKTTKTGEPLAGAVFNVLNKDGIIVAENVVSDEAGLVSVNDLAPGTYTIQETTTVDGYLLNTETVEFTIASSSEGTPVTLSIDNFKNYQGTAQLIKTNEAGKVLKDAVFEVRNSDGKVMDTLTSDENGRIMAEGLAPGNYTFVEVKAPGNYVKDTTDYPFTILDKFEGEPEVVTVGDVQNFKGSVVLEKVDVSGKGLSNAVFEIRDSKDNLIQSGLTSNNNGKVKVNGLAPGKYTISETQAPEGYVRNTDVVEFDIKDTTKGKPATVQLGQFINYQGSLEILKVDENEKALQGAEFSILDNDGKKVYSQLKSDNEGRILVEGLAPGYYSLIETKAPKSYIHSNKPISFEIAKESNGSVKRIQLKVINKKESLNTAITDDASNSGSGSGLLPQTGAEMLNTLLVLLGLLFISSGIFLVKRQNDK